MRIKMGRRLVWLCLFSLLILSGLGGRLYHLQIVRGPEYARMAFHQRTLSLPVGGRRGQILDRNGEPLTDPRPGWGVAAFPPLIKDAQGAARALADMLYRPELEDDLAWATKRDPVWLATGVDEGTAKAIQAMGLPGIVAAPVGDRYGAGALARHLVGYINQEGGKLGLEQAFEQELAGDAVPSMVAYLDGTGNPLSGLGIRAVVPGRGKAPYDVHTTIEMRIQQAVEHVLDRHTHPDGGPLRGAAVVMDPHTGEVLAMASRPQYEYGDLGVGSELLNRAVAGYPPGSIFKAIVAAAALERGEVSLDERFHCPGHYTVDGHRFTESKEGGHGDITFREAVAQSCNIVFLQIGHERLGTEALTEAARRFGFGSLTGPFGPDHAWSEEQPGAVPEPDDPGAVQVAFGQATLKVTPLQVARAFAAIANGGKLPPVRLVSQVTSPDGEVMSRPPGGSAERVISRTTALTLQKALSAVTAPEGKGTGRSAWIEGVGSAGKTGSAEGGESPDGRQKVHAWFAGYMPAWAPRYVIVVTVEEGQAGGQVAAPIFREIGQAILATGAY